MLLERSLRVMLFAICSTALAAGCGGLRRLPITGDDAGPGGIGGSSANAGRGGGGNSGTTGAAGSIAAAERRSRRVDDESWTRAASTRPPVLQVGRAYRRTRVTRECSSASRAAPCRAWS